MQRVLERAARAKRMLKGKVVRKQGGKTKQKLDDFYQEQYRMPHLAAHKEAGKQAKIKRREDWELGSLAPRRDVGEDFEKYGTKFTYLANGPPRLKKDRIPMDHLQLGDRVAVIRGRHKGKIGEIQRFAEEQCNVHIAGVNQADVFLPNWMTFSQDRKVEDTIETQHLGIAVENVRLVYPLKDATTGEIRDTIIKNVDIVMDHWEVDEDGRRRRRKEPEKYRKIRGSNIIIPWPEKGDPPEEDEHPADTLEADVREVTLDAPPLLYSPMPMGVIDELRNKYSKTRKRHDWDYVQRKEAEGAKEEARKDLINQMKTPTRQIAEAKVRQKEERTKELDDEQLASIGAIIAAAQAKTLNKVASAQ